MLDVVKKLFGTENLYEILQTTAEEANDPKKLRLCYLRAALSYHPDKAPDDEKATQKFQALSSVYDVLKDPDTKKVYDQTGEWPSDERFDLEGAVFARIDEEAIHKFKQEYQGSEIEKDDIKKYYMKGKGSYIEIFEHVFFANIIDDEERIRNIVEKCIEDGELERIPEPKGYAQKWKRYLAKMKKEAKEAEEMLAAFRKKEKQKSQGKGNAEDSLTAMILKRRETEGTNFLAQLEAKYGIGAEPEKKKRKRK